MQRLETSIVYHGAPTHIYIYNTLPLDNLKIHLHLALPYITREQEEDQVDRKESLYHNYIVHTVSMMSDKFSILMG